VNPAVSDALVRTVQAWFAGSPDAPDLLDLYCGVGVFGLACLKAGGARLTGIESGHAAVAAARHNAQSLGLPADFHCAALGQGRLNLRDWIRDPARTTCIVDPPRSGLAPDIAAALAASGLARLFYVSCDPATLTRDLAILLRGGYRIARVRLFDMFPRTAHFETLVELTPSH
jgi:tRNA/tmRNA/rRNA uracil-C5-methylase (TrmA/RlmC/RlmD family)